MQRQSSPLSNETAFLIAGIALFSFGNWISGGICIALAFWASATDRRRVLLEERANLPSDERNVKKRAELPAIAPPPSQAAPTDDPWDHDAKH